MRKIQGTTRYLLTKVTLLVIIMALVVGCGKQTKKNALYIHNLTSLNPTPNLIHTQVGQDLKNLESSWISKIFNKEVLNDLINTGIKAASGNYAGALQSLLALGGTVGLAVLAKKNKDKGNSLEAIREIAFEKGDDLLKELTTKKKGKKNV